MPLAAAPRLAGGRPFPSAIGLTSGDCRADLAGGRNCMAGGLAEWLCHFNDLIVKKTAAPACFSRDNAAETVSIRVMIIFPPSFFRYGKDEQRE